MSTFCINPFCLDKVEEMSNALFFLTDLWFVRGEDESLSFHIDNNCCSDACVDAFMDLIQQKDVNLARAIACKLFYPCFFTDEDVLNCLCEKKYYLWGQEKPEVVMFYYAYLKSYVVLSFSNNTNWDSVTLSFKVDTQGLCVDNLFYEKNRHKQIECKFFPFLKLEKDTRFRKSTHPPVKGAVVYEEVKTGNLWYKDTLHTGSREHFEVFSSLGVHIGEASMDGNMIPDSADPSKNWKI